MRLVLDAGALVAIERGDRELAAVIKRQWLAGVPARTHGGVVGQVWRGGAGRQAPLARALNSVQVVPLDGELGKTAGLLLGEAGMKDVIDAAVVVLADHNDWIITSDPEDLRPLAAAIGTHVEIVPV
jgi:hypothetical protein